MSVEVLSVQVSWSLSQYTSGISSLSEPRKPGLSFLSKGGVSLQKQGLRSGSKTQTCCGGKLWLL